MSSRASVLRHAGLGLALSTAFVTPPAAAVPMLSIDADPGVAGIQAVRSVPLGSSFEVAVLLNFDGQSLDTLTAGLSFNNTGGTVLGALSTAAGDLAGLNGGGTTFDTASVTPVLPGDALLPLTPQAAAVGFADDTGLFSVFDIVGWAPAPGSVSALTFSFVANAAGISSLQLNNVVDPSFVAILGDPLPVELSGARITITDPNQVPEPAPLALAMVGLASAAGMRRRRADGSA